LDVGVSVKEFTTMFQTQFFLPGSAVDLKTSIVAFEDHPVPAAAFFRNITTLGILDGESDGWVHAMNDGLAPDFQFRRRREPAGEEHYNHGDRVRHVVLILCPRRDSHGDIGRKRADYNSLE